MYFQGCKNYVVGNVMIGLISVVTSVFTAQLKLHQDPLIGAQAEVSILRQVLSLLQLWQRARKTSQYLTRGLSAQVIIILKCSYLTLILSSSLLLAVK